MNLKPISFYQLKYLILLVPLVLGIFFLFSPQTSSASSSHIKREGVSVTVISIPSKSNTYPTNKIIGCILLSITVLGVVLISKDTVGVSPLATLEKEEDKLLKLTSQERKIYNLLKEGKTNKEIASILFISVSTVKTHLNSLYKKLGISSRKEIY